MRVGGGGSGGGKMETTVLEEQFKKGRRKRKRKWARERTLSVCVEKLAGPMRYVAHGFSETSWEKYCQLRLKRTDRRQ